MDIWDRLFEAAAKEYHPEEVSPFVYAHHVVCALEADNGEIYTGFSFEACSGGRFDPVLPMGFYDPKVVTDSKQKNTATEEARSQYL